ncbi:MAG: hypothetical protein IKE94_09485 [Aeriscardovia sp.]|nr:hypothetical protein [Aeriscardovia sp.]
MQIVIEIPVEQYRLIMNSHRAGVARYVDKEGMMYAIKNGTPLPKGHGRIMDEKDILDTENNDGGWYDLTDMPEYIAGVKAIVEADKESEI